MAGQEKPKAPPTDYGPVQAARRLDLASWQFEAALREGLIPGAGTGGRWPAAVIEQAEHDRSAIVAAVGDEAPIGARRAAERLSERLGLDVDRADVDELVERKLLVAVGDYKGWALYDVRQLDALADQQRALLDRLVAERLMWLGRSLTRNEAMARLGWSRAEFDEVLVERGLTAGRFGRYGLADIQGLAKDEELEERVRGDRTLGADQAAAHLEIRRRDFDYCVAAGWISPTRWTDIEVSKRRTITVPLYRVADVDALRELPGVDWEAVRGVRPGEPSPLREFAALPTSRAALVAEFAADLGKEFDVDVSTSYDDRADEWRITWSPTADGEPTVTTVRAALTSDKDLRAHSPAIRLELVDTSAAAETVRAGSGVNRQEQR